MIPTLPALAPQSIQVNERSLRDYLNLAAQIADFFYFYDQTNQKNGTWAPFFLKDPLILLACISKLNYQEVYSTYLQVTRQWESPSLSNAAHFSSKLHLVNQLMDLLYELFKAIQKWGKDMLQSEQSYELKEFVFKQTKTLHRVNWWNLRLLQKHLAMSWQEIKPPETDLPTAPLPDIWFPQQISHQVDNLLYDREDQSGKRLRIEQAEDAEKSSILDPAMGLLQQIFQQTYGFCTQVVEQAAKAFESLLNSHQQAFADTQLLIVFLQLLQKQQAQMNQITERHLDFYYQSILKQTPRGATPDEAILKLTLKDEIEFFEIPAGMEFIAGEDKEGHPIIFATDHPTELNPIAIEHIIAMTPQAQSKITEFSKVHKNAKGEYLSWSLFDQSSSSASVPQTWKNNRWGFAIASPLLFLQSGKRIITLHFLSKDQSSTSVPSDESRGSTSVSSDKSHFPSHSHDLEIALSTAEAWYPLPVSQVALSPNMLQLTLPATAPPIVPFEEQQTFEDSPWPVLKVIYTGKSLPAATLTDFELKVTVKNMTHFELFNSDGKVLNEEPFFLFGSVPTMGNTFSLHSPELIAKPLESLTMNLMWEAVPGNLTQYYQAYNTYLKDYQATQGEKKQTTFTPSAFQVSLQPHKKAKLSENEQPLFEIDGDGPSIKSKSSFSFEAATADPSVLLIKEPLLNKATSLQLTLTAPQEAFGFSLYSKVVSHVTTENAFRIAAYYIKESQKKAEKPGPTVTSQAKELTEMITDTTAEQTDMTPKVDLLETPNWPYAPKVKLAKVHYTTKLKITPQSKSGSIAPSDYPFEFYHCAPLATYSAPLTTITTLFPRLAFDILDNHSPLCAEGVLYLALEHTPKLPCTLSLYFEMDAQEAPWVPKQASNQPPSVHYLGLTAKGWGKLHVLDDGTAQLAQSGILRLLVQPPLTTRHVQMPSGVAWIAIIVENVTTQQKQTRFRFLYLDTQVIHVKRMQTQALPVGVTPQLPAQKITAPVHPMPEIHSLVHSFPSRGGGSAESSMDFYQRVSRRIQTKDRALSKNDYCVMALEVDPHLAYVRCIVGQPLSLAVIPRYSNTKHPQAFYPEVSGARMETLKAFFQTRTSVFAPLDVFNPEHQAVTVQCHLFLNSLNNMGKVVQLLNHRLRLFLSPWIQSQSPQIDFDQGIQRTELFAFIKNQPEVKHVQSVLLSSDTALKTQPPTAASNGSNTTDSNWICVHPIKQKTIFVSAALHNIKVLNDAQSPQTGARHA